MTIIATTAQIAFDGCLVYIHAANISPSHIVELEKGGRNKT